MSGFPRARSAIVGAATFGIGEATGYSSMEITVNASLSALRQANLAPADVDALFVCQPGDFISGLSFAEYLGIQPKITDNNRTGGSAFLTHLTWAALALDAGLCDTALIAYGSNQRSAAGRLVSAAAPDPFEGVYKPRLPVGAYALAAARHMHEYGTTPEQLAEVAVSARHWANLNPEAFMQGELTIDEVLSARRVATPLGVRDCCLVTDGGAAVVVTRADRARDLTARPAYVLGSAAATFHMNIAMMPDLTVTAASQSGPAAFEQAGVSHDDIDVCELYDAFSINPILFMEDLGFCPKGEGGRYFEDGRTAPGGEMPVNTNGGGLSCVHPGMYSLFALVEAVEQIAQTAGKRQVADVDVALVHGNGGFLSSQATAILGSSNTV